MADGSRDEASHLGDRTASLSASFSEGAAVEVLLAKVAHEMRNPVNAVAGWVGVLRVGRPTEDVLARGLEAIDRNVRLQARLLDDLLDYAGLASGKLRLRSEVVDLAEIAAAAAEAIEPEAVARGVHVAAVTRSGPATVFADRTRLFQVFGNILANAVKFTPSGGRVDVSVEPGPGAFVRAHVRDTGRGIRSTDLQTIFELFEQGPAESASARDGLGIGLALVRQIVELHGGSIRAESPGEGLGATFTVEIPAAPG